ncbi:MAG: hypothetical protein J6M24_05580 [Lachnospiraceae bacterium]|nr:hypothetical protein [Lachnospiraceae bacterium]
MVITATAKDKHTVAAEYDAEDAINEAEAKYFHVLNMVKNSDQDGWYVLPMGKKRY